MAQKLFSTGPGTFKEGRTKRDTIDGLDRASCDSLFQSEMVLGKNELGSAYNITVTRD